MFKPVPTRGVDFPAMERELLRWWYEAGIVQKYLKKNEKSEKRWSFLDGPITANNPMGVHHAWGRTYKDFYQRFYTMLGYRQRYQNGFDCQGLWVEVEVEKELGFTSKQDIEAYGIDRFVEKCKERVFKYAAIQTEQSKRLGYFMDWDNSYYTLSDENNYMIWHFLKVCHQHGWIYHGYDVMPWCPRCATGLSEMEVSEGYQEVAHLSLYVRFPLEGRENESLLVWTTTPWTLAANVAAAVHPELTYVKARQGDQVYYLAKDAARTALRGQYEVLEELPGSALVGLAYRGPFDELPAMQGVAHRVIPWDEVDAEEGTGIVHIAPGAGREDYQLGKEFDLAVVAPLDENGVYLSGFDWLTGMRVGEVAEPIARNLEGRGLLYRSEQYTHRYPTCWRCGTELVFRLVDEWYIDVDPWRERVMEAAKTVRWIPEFGLERELDWLRNMDDWMISKKRYWGLALPIWQCPDCGWFDVIGSETELEERAIEGWEEFRGHSPHRPWIDKVKIRCEQCGGVASRIPDVGNPWLDAGIVPFSTLNYRHDRAYWQQWFPADFITESFPGQFRNWFYSLLAQSTVLVDQAPFKTVLGFASLRDEHGEEMHKSKGNAIWFDEAAEQVGVDVMRWLYLRHNPAQNLNFGYRLCDETRRQFLLPLWNSYAFFANYAALDGFHPAQHDVPLAERTLLDRWILSRLQEVVAVARERIADYDSAAACRAIQDFVVEELSNWYIRRNRRRFWKTESDRDKAAAYLTLYEVLVTLAKLLAPFIPYTAEAMYQNLVRSVDPSAPESVHLTDYPEPDEGKVDAALAQDMAWLLRAVELGRAARNKANVKVRQPLPRVLVGSRVPEALEAVRRLHDQLLDELNVKAFDVIERPEEYLTYRVRPNLPVLGPRLGPKLPALQRALAEADPAQVARAVRANRPVTVVVDGEEVELGPDDLLVEAIDREGFAAFEDRDLIVAVDLSITPELRLEGLARDFVRGVQEARKSAGFEIDDTIAVVYDAQGELAEAVERFADYIKNETLAVELRPGRPAEQDGHVEEVRVGKERFVVGLRRVGRLAKVTADGQ
ncbi:isoleucine--tRNA ligase [Thermomicrobiaceae bacterium CFH 74404]|uniref:Isoleucine--tRNA ligase n=1 Tax=Thermalbibacter longus TaxID=2951981 RepID=A0AA41WB87_9BACT|nr:isoleucine--tRNA ligase [Thermalbibacter longus]MCM8747578.1 isoleucine--tRNA ligase [Thermalbibacter longus]